VSHHDGPLDRNRNSNAIQRLPEQRATADEHRELLRPVVATDMARQRAQAAALAAGEHDRPGRQRRPSRPHQRHPGVRLDTRGRHRELGSKRELSPTMPMMELSPSFWRHRPALDM